MYTLLNDTKRLNEVFNDALDGRWEQRGGFIVTC